MVTSEVETTGVMMKVYGEKLLELLKRVEELQAENSRLAEAKQRMQFRQETCAKIRDSYVQRVVRLAKMVEQQAEDEGLWAIAETATEAYLQAALRRLHAVIEGEEEP